MPERPQFLCTLRPTRVAMLTEGMTDAERLTIERHFAYLARLASQGLLVLAGRTLEDSEATRGIAILNADDAAHAAELVNEDPAIVDGVMTATLQPFRVAIHADRSAT